MEAHPLMEYQEVACEAARRAGEVLDQMRQQFSVQEKGRFDLVTDADVAAQKAIQALLHQRFPDHDFLGEESPQAARSASKEDALLALRAAESGRPRWIVDPLDGTTNYVHDCPMYAVSIGLEIDGRVQVGAIFDPSRQELFHAALGHGAWLNDRRLQTSSVDRLENGLLSTGFPPDLTGHEQTLEKWTRLSFQAQSLRRTGSTALNLAYVASGRHDGFWIEKAHSWDVAAGIIIVQEAGGKVTNLTGGDFDIHSPSLVATNGPLHKSLVAALRAP